MSANEDIPINRIKELTMVLKHYFQGNSLKRKHIWGMKGDNNCTQL